MAYFDDTYNDVPARIREFRTKHPDSTLQSRVIRWPEDGFPFLAVEARAYRTPDDERPGVGLAYEPFPGKTNFTRDSELQNAETSAWGRAIVAVGAADTKKGVASADEVRNRKATAASSWSGAAGPPAPKGTTAGPPVAGGESSESVTQGEGVTGSDPLADLLEAVGGSEVKAVNQINRAVGGAYRKSDLENLTPDEYAAGLAAATMGGAS